MEQQKFASTLQFIHIRERDGRAGYRTHGGVTVGFAYEDRKDRFVVGVARCSPRDRYVKSIGRNLVMERISKADFESVLDEAVTNTYKVYTVKYSTILDEVSEVLSEILRPDAYAHAAVKLTEISSLAGSYINQRIANGALYLVSATRGGASEDT